MRIIIVLFLTLSVACFGQDDNKRGTIKVKKIAGIKRDTIQMFDSSINEINVTTPSVTSYLTFVEQMPQFPGGDKAMQDFIKTKIVYPQSAKAKRISGTCYVSFLVNEDGSISNIGILKNIPNCPECNAEAIRVVKLMPIWNPGKQNGRVVLVQYNLPIKFGVK